MLFDGIFGRIFRWCNDFSLCTFDFFSDTLDEISCMLEEWLIMMLSDQSLIPLFKSVMLTLTTKSSFIVSQEILKILTRLTLPRSIHLYPLKSCPLITTVTMILNLILHFDRWQKNLTHSRLYLFTIVRWIFHCWIDSQKVDYHLRRYFKLEECLWVRTGIIDSFQSGLLRINFRWFKENRSVNVLKLETLQNLSQTLIFILFY